MRVSPSARSDTGTPATSEASGSSRDSFRYSRSALEHSHSTRSLIDAPCALPRRLASSSGSVSAAKTRWLVIDTLKGVGGGIFSSAAQRAQAERGARPPTCARLPSSALPSGSASLPIIAHLAQRVRQRRAQQFGHAQLVAVRAVRRAAA